MSTAHRIDQFMRATRPALLLVMVACWAAPVVGLLENVLPGWDGAFLLVVAVLVGLEAIASERLRVRRGIRGADLWPYRLAEVGLLAVGALLLPYVWRGWDDLWADLERWSTDYIAICSVEYLLSLVWCLGLWFVVTEAIRDLDHLEVPRAAARPPHWSDGDARQDIKPDREGQAALDRLQGRFLWGGGALLLLAVGARLSATGRPGWDLGLLAGPLLDGLLYFAVGLFLLSQARLALLRLDAWGSDTAVDDTVPRRWLVYGAVFVLGVMALAALLPTGYTLGLLDVLRVVLGLAAMALLAVFNAVLWLYVYLLALLFSLLGLSRPAPEAEPVVAAPPAAAPMQLLGAPLRLDEWIQSAIFWVVIVLATGYVVIHFVRTRRHWFGPLLQLGWVRSFLRWLAGLRRAVEGVRRLRWPARPKPGALTVPMPPAPWRFLSLSRLSPRELVLYFYRSIVQRAGQQGHPRQPAQTPFEYSAALREQLPDAQPELDALTSAFVEARYSAHDIGPARAAGVRRVWETVKRAVRRLRQDARAGRPGP